MATLNLVKAALAALEAVAGAAASIFNDTVCANAAVAVKASAGTLYAVRIDNLANASPVYYKLWNVAQGSVTVGTTAPDEIIMVPASSIVLHEFKSGSPPVGGKAYSTAITHACVTTAGTAGTTSPTSPVLVEVAYT